MSTTTERPVATPRVSPSAMLQRGLTFRSLFTLLFALVLQGIWIYYTEFYIVGGPLGENAPPNSALSLITIFVVISALLALLYRPLKLTTAELVVVYAALIIAAPFSTQGMWLRFYGLITSIPHNKDFKSYESLPESLWPHGDNLVINGRFVHGLDGFTRSGEGTINWEHVSWKGKNWQVPVLTAADPVKPFGLSFSLPRFQGRREVLVPGEMYLLTLLVRARDIKEKSYYYISMQADNQVPMKIFAAARESTPTFVLRNGFERIGVSPVIIPRGLKHTLTLSVGQSGPGTLGLLDIQFFDVKAMEAAHTGIKLVRASHLRDLPDNERDFTVVKPDHIFSLAGARYLLVNYIPVGEWVRPIITWFVIIAAIFMGLFGLNVIMRRQWVRVECMTFPMLTVPRELFTEATDEKGHTYRPIFRSSMTWVGFGVFLPLVLAKGIHYYCPQFPAIFAWDIWGAAPNLATYVTDPNLKAFLGNMNINIPFSMFAIALLIDTDILFSIWVSFILFQFYYLFGRLFNFNRFAGYPWDWQQNIGSFIGYALCAAYTARRHLWEVAKRIAGRGRLDDSEEVISYRAAFLLILASLALFAGWGIYTRMGWAVSLLFFGYLLVCGFAASKVRAEAGIPHSYWMPYESMMFVSAVGGFAVFGATGMLVALLASGFMVTSNFLFMAPSQVEMMELGRRFRVRRRDISLALVLGLVGGVLIGGYCLLTWSYGLGGSNMKFDMPYNIDWYLRTYRQAELRMDSVVATHEPIVNSKTAPLNFVNNVDAKGVGIGVLTVCALTFLRNIFPWFPLHPLGYLMACTYFGWILWFSMCLAWAIRAILQRIGGAHMIRKGLIPFVIGGLMACVLSIVFFEVLGLYLHSVGIQDIYDKIP